MSEKKQPLLQGEIIKADEPAHNPAASSDIVSRPTRFPLLDELNAYADRRVKEAETKLKNAIAENIEAQTRITKATEEWVKAEERLQEDNLKDMRESIRLKIRADHEGAKLELDRIRTDQSLANLERKAKEAELRERIAKAEYQAQKHQRKLDGAEEDLEDLISKAEQDIEDIMEAFAEKRDAAEKTGESLSEEEEDLFSRKLQTAKERLDRLQERQRKEQDEDEA